MAIKTFAGSRRREPARRGKRQMAGWFIDGTNKMTIDDYKRNSQKTDLENILLVCSMR